MHLCYSLFYYTYLESGHSYTASVYDTGYSATQGDLSDRESESGYYVLWDGVLRRFGFWDFGIDMGFFLVLTLRG